MSPSFSDCTRCGTRNSLFNPRCIGCGARLLEADEPAGLEQAHADRDALPVLPRAIGAYTIDALIGSGSSARVFAAHETSSRQPVMLKVMRPELLSSDEARKRFGREARALALVDHPNVGRMLDVLDEPSPTLVLEVAAGVSLEQRLRHGALEADDSLRLVRQVAVALAALHAEGIVHRDVKPANIMVSDDLGVKLIDFGLARMLEHRPGSFRTAAGTVLGSLSYAAPEVVTGEPGGPAADCWSLGIVGFELATGRRAFDAPSRVALAAAIVGHRAGDVRVDGPFAEVVRLSLHPDARMRATAADLVALCAAAQKSRSDGSS